MAVRPSYAAEYGKRLDPYAGDIKELLYGAGRKRLQPGYEAISPEMQATMFGRIKEQLAPEFEEQMQAQLSNIYQQGIEGTPGSAILGKLRQDYLKGLSGRATDIGIESALRTESGRQYGGGLLERLRGGLVGEARDVAGKEYGLDVGDYEFGRLQEERKRQERMQLWSGLGGLAGTAATSYFSPQAGLQKALTEYLGKQ